MEKYCVAAEMKGKEITFAQMTKDLGSRATTALAVGQCATYGGNTCSKT